MTRHIREIDLALFAMGDVNLWKRAVARFHLAGCPQCRAKLQAYRLDREHLKQSAAEMPAGLNWDRLAAEMTANIRVGLAAGECVAPRGRKRMVRTWWPAAAMASAGVFLTMTAWWLNLPSSDTDSLARVMRRIVHLRSGPADEQPVVEASSDGIRAMENGNTLRPTQGTAKPQFVLVNTEGSASASYVDDSDQITITSVMNVQ